MYHPYVEAVRTASQYWNAAVGSVPNADLSARNGGVAAGKARWKVTTLLIGAFPAVKFA